MVRAAGPPFAAATHTMIPAAVSRVHLAAERRPGRAGSTERQVHHLNVLPGRPRHRREHRVLRPAADRKTLRDHEHRFRCDAPVHRAGARNDAGHVCAVADVVDHPGPAEVARQRDPRGEVRMRVGTGVHDRDADAGTAVAAGPHHRDAQGGHALVQQRLHRVGWPRGQPDRTQRVDEPRLPLRRDVDHDHVRAAVGLADRRTESREEVRGDAGPGAQGGGVLGIARPEGPTSRSAYPARP